jgi:RNase P subunit RPR2
MVEIICKECQRPLQFSDDWETREIIEKTCHMGDEIEMHLAVICRSCLDKP